MRPITLLKSQQDLVMVLCVVGILTMLFVPIPAALLDLLLIVNLAFGLLILLLTFYTDKPLSFSTFPSLLLITTLFRLGLNIASTRLILSDGDAGNVIGTIGEFVVSGNYVVGLVVFFILIVVQYVVVTNGAQRVAEVAARFTLDSMPGKQMSIDADLNMGLIDDKQAKTRRENIEKEANFYGAMDGASKFVKGDAIAGIIIILINIIGGLSIGIAQQGMGWGDAMHTYTLLTVGDGLVTQIPSLIISTATGIIITRAATDAQLGTELGQQIVSNPKPLFIVSAALLLSLLAPGLPRLPIILLAAFFLLLGFVAFKNRSKPDEEQFSVNSPDTLSEQSAPASSIESLLKVYPIELATSASLYEKIHQSPAVSSRYETFRKQFAFDMGVVLPAIDVVSDAKLKSQYYEIRLLGVVFGKGELYPEQNLVMGAKKEFMPENGIATKEPTYGLPAIWVDDTHAALARAAKYTVVDAQTVLLTHITEILKSHAYELLTRQETEKLINRVSSSNAGLVDEIIPTTFSYSDIQKLLQHLLKEKVSVKNLTAILECLAENAKLSKDFNFLLEQCRLKLKGHIVQKLTDHEGCLHVITLESALEQQLLQGLQIDQGKAFFSIEPQLAEQVIQQLTALSDSLISRRLAIVVLCYPQVRAAFKQLIDRVLPHTHVLSINEVPTSVPVKTVGLVMRNGKAA
jgi:flagellar biosynthesis protein FlhA